MAVVVFENVLKGYGGRPVLAGVSFELAGADRVGLYQDYSARVTGESL
jgi:ATPase subunit of ABC transporter with duplicated ATPase domains